MLNLCCPNFNILSLFPCMTQVILSSHSTFMPQLSGNDSHGLCHLTQEQSTDILHLCGFHKFTYQHTHTDICTCKLNVCFSFLCVFFIRLWALCSCCHLYQMGSTSIIPCWYCCCALLHITSKPAISNNFCTFLCIFPT